MTRRRRSPLLAAGATVLVAIGVVFGLGVRQVSAAGTVSAVAGSAYGLRTYGITIFGGAQTDAGPKPSVALQSNASGGPQSATASTEVVQYGPATLFTSDGISVQTTGSLGAAGSVTSRSSVKNINRATTQTSTGSEPLTVGTLVGSCSATAAGTTGSTTITGGTLHTDSGLDNNNDGNYTDPGEHPPVTVALPANPRPNTTISGVVYTSATAKDSFHMVFNEQSRNGAGQLTVNPVHEYFDGPILKGNLVIGQVVCGVTVAASTPTSVPTPAAATTTTSSTETTSSSDTSSTLTTATPSPPAATPSPTGAVPTGSSGGGGRTGAVVAAAGGGAVLVGLLAFWWARKRRAPTP